MCQWWVLSRPNSKWIHFDNQLQALTATNLSVINLDPNVDTSIISDAQAATFNRDPQQGAIRNN